MPEVGSSKRFEIEYMSKLRALLAVHGQFVKYEEDLAALDLGLHLYHDAEDSDRTTVGDVRIWIQAKGIQAATLGAEQLKGARTVAVRDLRSEHVEYWYAAPEPVYLVVYIESLDTFLAQDVRTLVQGQLDVSALHDLVATQKTVTLGVPLTATLDAAVSQMHAHRSMRIDMKAFRGRPLGHGFDPLRSSFESPAPEVFKDIVSDILNAHEFKLTENIDVKIVFDSCPDGTEVRRGSLLLTYEWTSPLFTEFGYGKVSEFRIESPPQHVQGEVVVVIAPTNQRPFMNAKLPELVDTWRESGVERVLIFYNGPDLDAKLSSGWRIPFGLLCSAPQGIGSITFNILTMTTVYLKHIRHLKLGVTNYL